MNTDHRALVERLFPDLEVRSIEPVGEGWTVATFEVNGAWIVQVPRAEGSAARLRAQIDLLPELAQEVSALIPVPERVSLDPPAMVYPKLGGVPANAAPGGIWPERLGRFLYDLHLVPPEFIGMRAASTEAVRSRQREVVDRLRDPVLSSLSSEEASRAGAWLDRYLDDDSLWTFASCLTHGDLGPEHVLVGAGGDLVGVIDWEEASVGDPAVDFAWWLHAMPAEGERALAAYGGAPDAAFRERARSLFILMPWYDVAYGLEAGEPRVLQRGLEELRVRLR